jgi:type II secretory pathway component PulF
LDKEEAMTIPRPLIGTICLIAGLLLTFVLPIQRRRLSNQLWDFITLALFVAGFYLLGYFNTIVNIVLGAIVGFVAILIRDFRLWVVRFKGQMYGRSHRYHWYGRARDWYGRRRRRW